MYSLVFRSAKMAFFLAMVLAIPFLLEIECVLTLWLKEVPPYTALFVRMAIIIMLIDIFNNPIFGMVQAVGKVKNYQLSVSILWLLILPISYLLLSFGFPPETPLYVNIALSIICYVPRLLIAQKVGFPIKLFCTRVIIICAIVFGISFLPTYCIWNLMQPYFPRFCVVFACDIIFSSFAMYIVGLTKEEKKYIISLIEKKLKRKIHL
jgi:hypothetical protein